MGPWSNEGADEHKSSPLHFNPVIRKSGRRFVFWSLQQQIHHNPPLRRRDVISQRRPSFFTHVKQLAAIIVALGFLFWLWFGVSTYHAPRASYPYYDTQKPVPPWSRAHA